VNSELGALWKESLLSLIFAWRDRKITNIFVRIVNVLAAEVARS
jgi:hypothetical protein